MGSWLALVLLGCSVISTVLIPSQKDFTIILCLYVTAFLSYLYLLRSSLSLNAMLYFAIGIRLILVFCFPNLSDDIYRFIWDGNLIRSGINPYSLLPTEALSQNHPGNTLQLFEHLNSPNYYTVYPPLSQAIFYLSTLFEANWYVSMLIQKFFLLIAEMGSIFLLLRILKHLNLKSRRVLIYALNPLIMIELMGNLHYEALSLFFLLLAIDYILRQKEKYSALALSLGVAAKMLPLMFIPFLWKFTSRRVLYLLIFLSAIIILFLPILLGIEIQHFGESLDLYFGKFEFNGGVYNVLRSIGQALSGYNLIRFIGPAMALITLGGMAVMFTKMKQGSHLHLLNFSFWSITLYYLLSTTVHPWYLTLPLALSVFTHYRFVVIWTGMIILSYINYSYDPYWENLYAIGLEYFIVFAFLIYECLKEGKNEFPKKEKVINFR